MAFRKETGEVAWSKKVGKQRNKFYDLDFPILEYKKQLLTTDAAGKIVYLNSKSGAIEQELLVDATTNLLILGDGFP